MSLFQLARTTLMYSGSKYTHKHLEQGAIKNKNHILLSCSAATGVSQASSLTKVRVSSQLKGEVCTCRQFKRSQDNQQEHLDLWFIDQSWVNSQESPSKVKFQANLKWSHNMRWKRLHYFAESQMYFILISGQRT